jgi:outer membrane receptor protein involved in Fe transport
VTNTTNFKRIALSTTILASALAAVPARAQQEAPAATIEEAPSGDIIVTGTRRSTTLQDTPINISAVSSEQIDKLRIDDVRDLADFVPGITISDTGPRSTGAVVLRGLNASDVDDSGAGYDDALGIYLGEVPLYYDFKLLDLERVETLLGPQGTLYGLGTLAGAIRYIPRRPDLDKVEAEGHGRTYVKSQSGQVGYQADAVVNLPIVPDLIALRSVVGYYFDPGFIDYPLLLRQPGTSLPQAGGTGNSLGSAYDANLYRRKDANFERTFTTRNQLMIEPNTDFRTIITYAYQQTKTDGRQSNSFGVLGTDRYENASRYLEPVDRHAHLLSAEINANLGGIADLVSTTAYTEVKARTQGDVTDLLLDLDYDYEAFPAFSGFNRSVTDRKQLNQELRLVSRHGGPINWTLGGFYNRNTYRSDYFESTPGLSDFYGVPDNPNDIEYASYIRSKLIEKAIFGEATLKVTPDFQVTAGARHYDYTSEITGALVLPLLGDPVSPFEGTPAGGKTKNSGWVWKFNTSYKFSPEVLVYATYSKGYRVGGPNRVAPCPDPVPANQQNACALPNEQQFGPDTTKNLEIGIRTQLFDRKLSFDFDVFNIDWDGIQLDSATFYGVTGITVNGGTARSRGVEATLVARPTPQLTIQGTYSYVDAKLTQDVPSLISVRATPGNYDARPKFVQLTALDGDRLPGSARHSGSIGATYTQPLGNGAELSGNWTTTYRGDVVSRLGWERAYGDKIPAFTLHRASLTYSTDSYDLSLWANNIFDKYAYNSVGQDRSRIGVNDGVAVRYYTRSVISPRTVGIEGRIKFR